MNERSRQLVVIGEPGMRLVKPPLRTVLRSTVSAAVLLWFMAPAMAQQLPSGGAVSSGNATISQPNGSTLNINQSSNQAIINWQTFSVGTGGTVNFNQPGSSSATLNRVLGSTPSSIAGAINAPGTVLLVNPNGIFITKSGVINTGSFAASTLDISDSDFLAGNYKFKGNGGSAAVTNSGRINVSDGGFAALLGGQINNNGVITARLGKVGLGAGEAAALDLSGDGFLSVTVPSSELGNLVRGDRALVSNKGRIVADGGVVYLSAATASNILRNAVNIPGAVRANTVGSHEGRIVINGGAGGGVKISGRLVANGSAKRDTAASGGKGGTINVTAANVSVVGALIDASGATGGGTIQIGGGLQGSGPLAHAVNVSIDSASTVRADALDNGNGGTIAVWSDGNTSATGTFSARGGANGGNGGMVETSGPVLSINGVKVDTSAAYGRTGEWLLDPVDLTVDAAAANTISSNLGSSNVTLLTTSSSASGTGNQSAGLGDININAAISWSSANTLTLTAYHAININAQVSPGQSGKVVLNSGFDPTYTNLALINYSATGALTFTLGSGASTLTINGAAYTLVFTEGDIRSISQSGNIAMARDIGLNNNWGTYLGTFTGTFTGLGNQLSVGYNNYFASSIAASGTIRDIKLNAQTAYTFVQSSTLNTIWGNPRSSLAQTSAGTVANIYLTGTFNSEAALIGTVTGGLITNVYVTGLLNNNQAAIASSMTGGTLRNAYSLTGNGTLLGNVSNSTVSNVYTNASGGLANSATNTTFTNAYYDISTRGSTSSYGTGLTTAQLQGGLPTGFDSGTWAISTGTTYPYLRSAFNTAPQIVSGTGYSSTAGGVWQNTTVNLEIDTYSYFQASRTGNNGYYYFQLPTAEIQSSGSTVVTYIGSGNFSDYYAAATLALNATGSVRNMGLLNDSIGVWTTATTLSDPRISTDLTNALNAALTQLRPNTYQTYYLQYGSLGNYTPSIQTRRILNAAGSFTIESSNGAFSAITAADDLTLNTSFGSVAGYTPMIAAGRDIILNTGLSSGWMRAGRDVKVSTAFTTDNMTMYAGGDIAFNAAVNVSGMYLNAGDDILINAALTSTGTLQVNAVDTISGSGAVNVAAFWLQTGNYRQIGSLGSFSTADFRLSAGTTFLRVLGGDGSAGNAYQIADVYGLQGVGRALSLNYKLMNDIDATATATWNANAGFVAIGNGQTNATAFTGSFDGQGHVIDGLTINRNGTNDIGLFGSNAGHIFDLGVANGRIVGTGNVGALAGNNLQGGVIERSFGAAPVTGSTSVGGLIGANTGTISQSYSTSSVTGNTRVGGLVGYNRHTATADGNIHDSYAQGSVNGNAQVGGFYGLNDSLTAITASYSTGKVTANSVFGGFGGLQSGAASVSSYWNTETSAQTDAASAGSDAGVTGLTSSAMQAALQTGFSSSVWGIVAGKSFPYLNWQFPGGTPQVVTGYAYKDNGVTLINGGLINAAIDGVTLGRGVTYSNGLYIVLIPNGSIQSSGSNVLAYYTANSSQGLLNSASFAYQATDSVTMGDIWGGYLSIPAPGGLVSTANPAIASAWSSANSVGTSFINGLTGARLGGSGNFTVDVAPDTSGGKVFITTSGANDIIVGSVAFANSNMIVLNSAHDILVNGAVSGNGNLSFVAANNIVFNGVMSGTNDVTLKAGGTATANAAFSVDVFTLDGTWSQIMSSMPAFSANSMVFTSGAFIRALGGDGTSVNPYQLTDVYGLQGLLSPLLMNKNFVLANNIDASVTASWNSGAGFIPIGVGDQEMRPGSAGGVILGSNNHAVVDNAGSFWGSLDGQGYTINNITIVASRNDVGIFGSNAGTIKNIGVVDGTISGGDYVGGLVGFNYGTITRSYTSLVNVSGRGAIGGFVGGNGNGGVISESYANSRVGGQYDAAGFVGAASGGTFWADGNGFHTNYFAGTITNSYSMAAGGAGGFAGEGGVTNSIALEGGLANYATTYGTTGLPTGFDPTIWGIVPGYSYPYLKWQFAAGTTPQAITGQVIDSPGGSAFGNVPVSAVVNGVSVGNSFADGYGFYQLLLPQGTVGAGSSLLVYTPTLGAGGGAALQSVSGSARDNNIYGGGYVQWTTASSSYSNAGYTAELTSAVGSNASVQSFVNGLTGLAITSTGAGPYVVGQALTAAGGLFITANGISVTAAINAGGAVRLTAVNNNDITINDVVFSGGALTLSGRDLTVNAAMTSGGTATLNGRTLTIAAALAANGAATLNATAAFNATSSITANGAVTITGTSVTTGALYWANGALTVTATGAVTFNGLLSGAGPGAGATISGTSITANSTIDWQAGLMRLQATAGSVMLNGNLNGWGPGAGLNISGQSITMRSAAWQNGALTIAASAGAVNVTGSLTGSGAGASANVTGRSVSISGGLTWANGGLNLAASAGDVIVGGAVVGNGGGGVGGTNITLGGLTWANGTMTTTASAALTINGNVDGMGSGWVINAGTIAVSGAVGVQTFQLNSGNWLQNSANLPAFYAVNFTLGGGVQFTRFSGGDGSFGNPYNIVDIYGLQGLVTTASLYNRNFVLGADIQAGITSGWNGGNGFIPIGSAGQQFTGSFNGQNHDINGLTINLPGNDNVGLFGYINGGTSVISNLNLTNVTINGNNNVGGLAGSIGATVRNVTVTGNVTGRGNNVGGLAGNAFAGNGSNVGGFTLAGFTGNVFAGTPQFIDLGGGVLQGIIGGGTGGSNVGGLVGVTTVLVSGSYAFGTVTSQGTNSANTGGLIGWLQSTSTNINNNAYVLNSVSGATVLAYGNGLPGHGGGSGGWFVGGLIGQNGNLGSNFSYSVGGKRQIGGFVTSSFATGSVTAAGMSLGGLVGYNAGSIVDSGASGFVARVGSSSLPANASALYGVGGLVGFNGGGIARSWATGSYVANDCGNCGTFTGGLVGQHGAPGIGEVVLNWETATISNSYATDSVWGSGPTGGLIGALQNPATVTGTYAMGDVHGPSGSSGGIIGWVVNNNSGDVNLYNYYNSDTSGMSSAIGYVVPGGGSGGSWFYGMTDGSARFPGATIGLRLVTGTLPDGSQVTLPIPVNSYEGFDFGSTWMQSTAGYPVLRTQTVLIVGNNTSAAYGSAPSSLSYTAYGQLGYQSVSGVTMSANGTMVLGSGGSLSNGGNVTFVYLPGSVAITPRAITVQGGSLTRVYGDSNPTGTSSVGVGGAGLAAGDTIGYAGVSNGPSAANNTHNGGADADAGYSYGYTTSNAFFTSGSALNYTITYVNGSIAVTPRAVSVQLIGSTSKTYDGNTSANLAPSNFRVANVFPGLPDYGALSSTTGTSGTYGSANAGSGINVSVTGIALITTNPALANNYTLTSTTASGAIGTITPKTLSGAANIAGIDKTYDGTTAAGAGSLLLSGAAYGFIGSDSATLNSLGGVYDSANAGARGVSNLSGLSLSNGNYRVGTLAVTGTGTITPASITVTATGGSSSYGATSANPGITATGLKNNESVAVLTGLANSFGIDALTDAGGYALNVLGTLTNGNYNITSRVAGTWTVNPALITVTATGGTSVYGQSPTNPGFTASGLQNGQSEAVLTGLSNSFGINNLSDAQGYALNVVGTQGNGNYTVINRVAGTWTVNPAPITVTATGGTSVYGQSPTNPGFTASGLQNGQNEAVLTGLSNSFGISNLSDAQGYALNVVGTQGNANYIVTNRVDSTWTVTPAPITITANGGTSVYGGSPTNPGITALGLQNGQSESVLTGLSNSFGIDSFSNAGNHTTNVAGTLTNTNYSVTGTSTGIWTVTPASIIVTATGGSSSYGATPANPGITATGLQNGEGVAVLTGLSNSFGIDGLTDAGGYALNVLGALTNGNYNITSRVAGTWTVNPALITVTATGGTSVYGQSSTNPGFTASGLQNGQNETVLSGLANSFGITNLSNAQDYTLSVNGTLTNGNYIVTGRTDGIWTVTPAPITVTATGGTSVYGQSPTNPGFTASGLQNGQNETILTGLSNSFGITNLSDAQGYTLSVAGTQGNTNYVVTNRIDGTWIVTPAPITVSANGGTSVYGGSPTNPGITALGLQNGQSETVLTGLLNSFGIDRFSNAGDHTLGVNGTLTNGNYTVTGTSTGTWTVTHAPLTVTANSPSKTYGDTLVFAGTEFGSSGLQNGESIGTVALTSAGQAATANVAGGPYAIVPTNAAGGTFNIANYNVSYVNGALTVTPASVIVTALGGTSTYGTSPANPGLSASGLKNGEDVSVLSGLSNSFGIDNFSNVGNHTTSVAGALGNTNYTVTNTVTGTWIIDPAQLTYVANPATRYFGDSNPLFGGTVTGFLNGETLASATTGALSFNSPATSNSIIGNYAIDGSGLAAQNYVFVQATSNDTALSVIAPPTNPGSQFTPPGGSTPMTGVTVSFQTTGAATGPIQVSFTPRVASNGGTDVSPAALPGANPLGSNNGRTYQPISQFDANQYSQFQVPGYAADAGQAALFTIIARAAAPDQAANFMIDTFWNGTAADLNGANGKNPLTGKVTFSDGAGNEVTPGAANGFAIEPGKTNFAELLKSGPVMLGGAPGQSPAQWLLATGLSADGKNMLCADPVSGKVVALSFDAATGAVGGVAGFYDEKSKGIVSLADSSGAPPAGAAPNALQNFKPSTFFAVKVQ